MRVKHSSLFKNKLTPEILRDVGGGSL